MWKHSRWYLAGSRTRGTTCFACLTVKIPTPHLIMFAIFRRRRRTRSCLRTRESWPSRRFSKHAHVVPSLILSREQTSKRVTSACVFPFHVSSPSRSFGFTRWSWIFSKRWIRGVWPTCLRFVDTQNSQVPWISLIFCSFFSIRSAEVCITYI